MKRLALLLIVILIACCAVGGYYFNQYWIHQYDALIARQAAVYRLDPDLVWSIIYEETYFRPWKNGKDGEIGLMQVTPMVAREWAAETGMRDLERKAAQSPESILRDPERNIQVGCWYLEKLYEDYRDVPGTEARMVAGYNAGPSRVSTWSETKNDTPLSTDQFISKIDIASTRSYVTSILSRYQRIKSGKLQGVEPQASAGDNERGTTGARGSVR
jgi:soluble lytic murein transglycosylase